MDWLLPVGWIASGVVGGQLLSYPGDGLNARHFLGAIVGPVSLIVYLLELATD